jgi:uncharacterized protein YjbI with pentapeptide repeats
VLLAVEELVLLEVDELVLLEEDELVLLEVEELELSFDLDFSDLHSPDLDFSDLHSPDLDFSDLHSPDLDFSDLHPPDLDFSSQSSTGITSGASARILLEETLDFLTTLLAQECLVMTIASSVCLFSRMMSWSFMMV